MAQELSMNEMEQVTGGVWHEVETGMDGVDAAVRAEPKKSSRQIGHIPNGTMVNTTSDTLYYDADSRRHYVEVNWNGRIGYVASSILGLRR